VLIEKREAPWRLMRGISWGILPLVAGLFVLVQGLNNTGVVAQLTELLKWGV
jgi:arsenical pump membrane protein